MLNVCFHFIHRNNSIFDKKKVEDPTQLINTYEMTELVGIVSLLYGMLLHSGAPSRSDMSPPEYPQHTMAVALTGLKMLNNMATLDLHMLQVQILSFRINFSQNNLVISSFLILISEHVCIYILTVHGIYSRKKLCPFKHIWLGEYSGSKSPVK